eukprot:TRINITY_DN1474_c2_g1_i1.p1 TRINITY_DN1474_c2_g1~~TRINITY_DN1474_c2_g1_i1.p1  ORF type:complete len:574 (-),score=166.47 TRINITY_DN1474_c2_g1_i1:379-2100(-)
MNVRMLIIVLLSSLLYFGEGGRAQSSPSSGNFSSSEDTRSSKEVKLFDRIASAIFGGGKSGGGKQHHPGPPPGKRGAIRPPIHSGPLTHPQLPPPQLPPPQIPQSAPRPTIINNKIGAHVGGGGGGQFSDASKSSNSLDRWQIAQPASMAQIKDLQVQCEKELMRVRVIFDRPFHGMIFSKGYYSNRNCVHTPAGLGQTTVTFDISLRACGMVSSVNSDYQSPQGQYIENTIIIQYDPQLQEVWDQARKLRCTWYDFYEKSVTFKPYQVNTLDPVTANFLGDNLRCWMQIQVGKGPHASEVSGIVKIGQTMTMVLGIKDDENKFDMMIRNCVAHDGIRSPITLVNEKGCVARPKIMSNFKKIKNFDVTANVLAYAYFQAFKFPDSMNVHFQCVVQVCRGSCPTPSCGPKKDFYTEDSYGPPRGSPLTHYKSNGLISPRVNRNIFVGNETGAESSSLDTSTNLLEESSSRSRRSVSSSSEDEEEDTQAVDVETKKVIRVVAPSDVQFQLSAEDKEEVVLSSSSSNLPERDVLCIYTAAFVASTIAFLMILVIALITIIFLWMRVRTLNRKLLCH